MQSVTKEYRTETGHRLMDYNGKCSHLHGHSYLWQITVESEELTHNGMVIDFKHVKAAMKFVLEPLDHAMVLAQNDPSVGVISTLPATNAEKQRVIIMPFNPTAENFAAWAGKEIGLYLMESHLNIKCHVVKVRVWETASSFAEWTNASKSK